MNVTATPAPKSAVKLEVELPPERLTQAIQEAVRHLSKRTRVPGFRPGKAPRGVLEAVLGHGAVLDEAVELLVQDAYKKALIEQQILPLTNADVEILQAEEGKPVRFTATVPVRPEVTLGDYRNFNFRPEIDTIDDARVDKVIDELRDQHATLAAVEDRGARKGDYAVIGFEGTRNGEPIEGASTERMPLILGEERLIPGFEDHLMGLKVGDEAEFDITFPDDYLEPDLAGQAARFKATLRELREKIAPVADDEFARSMGDYADLAALRSEVKARLERNALDSARHGFADRIIEYAVSNATLDLPDVLIDQEVEVLHDELRSTLARQGISEEAYLKAAEKTDEALHADFRPRAEQRVKVLLVLAKIADVEGVSADEAEVEAEIARGRERYGKDQKLIRYFDSDRGRNFIRSTLRRSRLVERLVDDWLAAHPEHPALPHAEAASSPAATEPATPNDPDTATDTDTETEAQTPTASPAG